MSNAKASCVPPKTVEPFNEFCKAQFEKMFPGKGEYYDAFIKSMKARGINNKNNQILFFGQISHETNNLMWTEEIASGEAYEGRADLGNTQPGDGKRFKGRGAMQLTGRDNYKKYGENKADGKDYTDDETIASLKNDKDFIADTASYYWAEKKPALKALDSVDNKNIYKASKSVNGFTASESEFYDFYANKKSDAFLERRTNDILLSPYEKESKKLYKEGRLKEQILQDEQIKKGNPSKSLTDKELKQIKKDAERKVNAELNQPDVKEKIKKDASSKLKKDKENGVLPEETQKKAVKKANSEHEHMIGETKRLDRTKTIEKHMNNTSLCNPGSAPNA